MLTGWMLKQPEIDRVMTAGANLLPFKPCLPNAFVEEIRDVLAHPAAL